MYDEEEVFDLIGKTVYLGDQSGTIADIRITNIPCCAMLVTFIIQTDNGIVEEDSTKFHEDNDGNFVLK